MDPLHIALGIIGGLCTIIGVLLGWWIKSVEQNNHVRIGSVNKRVDEVDARLNQHADHIGKLYSKTNDLEVTVAQDHYTKAEIRDAINTVADNAVRVLSAQMAAIQRQLDDLRLSMFKKETGS